MSRHLGYRLLGVAALLGVAGRLAVDRPVRLGLDLRGGRLRAWLGSRRPDLIGRARWWLAISLVAFAVAVAGLVVRGPNLGVEFTGGRLLEYHTQRPVDLDATRRALADAGFGRAVVQASGDGNLTVRTGQLGGDAGQRIEQAVRSVAGPTERRRAEFIGPTIGAELRRKAVVALAVALAAQLADMAVRFRWTFGAAAVLAMFHDVANQACLRTIPRTVNTGLGALFIPAALFALGGETLTDFALALLVGILVGAYSPVFLATPLAVAFQRRRRGPGR